jgi:F0F1-type ATP synthase assembly protein I
MSEKKLTTRLIQTLALVWIAGAVMLRVYASNGGDASIVGGLAFLIWTAPFGPIWQFWVADFALRFFETSAVECIGDAFSIFTGAVIWFWLLPKFIRRHVSEVARKKVQ